MRAGLRDFYEGDIAASVAADIAALGGVVSLKDLRDCQVRTWPAEQVGWRRADAAIDRRIDRGADAEARAGGDGRCAL